MGKQTCHSQMVLWGVNQLKAKGIQTCKLLRVRDAAKYQIQVCFKELTSRLEFNFVQLNVSVCKIW